MSGNDEVGRIVVALSEYIPVRLTFAFYTTHTIANVYWRVRYLSVKFVSG